MPTSETPIDQKRAIMQYKPNTNPIQTQYKPNTNPIPEMPKMNENLFATKVYEKITTFRLEQNKPNTNPISKAAPTHSPSKAQILEFSPQKKIV